APGAGYRGPSGAPPGTGSGRAPTGYAARTTGGAPRKGPAPASKEPPPRAGPLRGPLGAPPALGCRPWARQAPPGTPPEGPQLAPSFASYWLPEGGRLPKGRTRAAVPQTRPEGAGGSTVCVQPVKELD